MTVWETSIGIFYVASLYVLFRHILHERLIDCGYLHPKTYVFERCNWGPHEIISIFVLFLFYRLISQDIKFAYWLFLGLLALVDGLTGWVYDDTSFLVFFLSLVIVLCCPDNDLYLLDPLNLCFIGIILLGLFTKKVGLGDLLPILSVLLVCGDLYRPIILASYVGMLYFVFCLLRGMPYKEAKVIPFLPMIFSGSILSQIF